MLRSFLFFVLLGCSLGATEYLQSNYYTNRDEIWLSDIVDEPQKDLLLYEIKSSRHIKRVRSKELLAVLKKHGYEMFDSKHSYVQFSKKSPINIEKIKTELIEHYKSKYSSIKIHSLHLEPRTYLQELPKSYSFGIHKRAHLSNKDYCYIQTPERKKIFFSYTINATIEVYVSKEEIDRGGVLSNLNTTKKSIMLEKFRALPLQNIETNALEAKHRLRANEVLTSRDAVARYLVKRGATVSVSFLNNGISISFIAKALTSGRAGDIITVQQRNDKKLRVRVTGHNRAEM